MPDRYQICPCHHPRVPGSSTLANLVGEEADNGERQGETSIQHLRPFHPSGIFVQKCMYHSPSRKKNNPSNKLGRHSHAVINERSAQSWTPPESKRDEAEKDNHRQVYRVKSLVERQWHEVDGEQVRHRGRYA